MLTGIFSQLQFDHGIMAVYLLGKVSSYFHIHVYSWQKLTTIKFNWINSVKIKG